MIYQFDTRISPEIRYILSIDPGFRTSGFTFIDTKKAKVSLWSSKKNDVKIMKKPMPELFQIAMERSKYYEIWETQR